MKTPRQRPLEISPTLAGNIEPEERKACLPSFLGSLPGQSREGVWQRVDLFIASVLPSYEALGELPQARTQ